MKHCLISTVNVFFLQSVLPFLVENCFVLALPFVYWVAHDKHWVEYLVLVHILIVVLLTGLAMAKTGSTEEVGWQLFLRYRVRDINYESFFIKHTLLRIQVLCCLHYTHCLPQ